MSKSKHDAAMLLLTAKAGLLGTEVLPVLKFMAGFSAPPISVSEEAIRKLELLDLVRQDVNLMDGKNVLLLTSYGKKIVAVMRENQKDFTETA